MPYGVRSKNMKIGYACVPLTIDARTSRRLIIKNFNYDNFFVITKANLTDLRLILEHNIKNNIFMFRISSDIIPLGSHEINDIQWQEIFKYELEDTGKFIRENNIRVSMHPGQYTVLNSNSEEVVAKSIKDIEYHTLFLDSLKVDFTNKIVLHIGGVYGDKESAIERFILNFKRLSPQAQKRLIIENDDKSYTVKDVLSISKVLDIPVVFDNLHHLLNSETSENLESILKEVALTWKELDGPMKLHYSDSSGSKRAGAHSKFVFTKNFIPYLNEVKDFDPDIMLEVKDKDISAIKCIQFTSKVQKIHTLYDMWAKYKYLVMEKDYKLYKQCSNMVKSKCTLTVFYEFIDEVLSLPLNEKNFINTAYHIWGYFKNVATPSERKKFDFYINNKELNEKFKQFLKKLACKYNVEYLLNSYYFLY